MLTETDRQAMMQELDAASEGLWVEIASELQRGGAELPIWVLVGSPQSIRPAFKRILAITRPYREKADETEFSISFDEFRDGRLFNWNHVEPYEIQSGQLLFELGAEPTEYRGTETVYQTVRAKWEANGV